MLVFRLLQIKKNLALLLFFLRYQLNLGNKFKDKGFMILVSEKKMELPEIRI